MELGLTSEDWTAEWHADRERARGEAATDPSAWASVIPRRYREATVGGVHDGGLRARLAGWDWRTGALLFGPKGTGKTYAAAALAKAAGLWPHEVAWISTSRLFFDMRRNMDGAKLELPDLTRAELVVFDDLGKERPSPWVKENLFVMVDDLYNREARVIVTSNVTHPRELEAHVGEYSFDRFRDMLTAVPVVGDSKRGRPHAQDADAGD